MNLQVNDADIRKKMQVLFLIAAAVVPFMAILVDTVSPGTGYFLAEKWMAVPCLLFFGSALTQRQSASAGKSLLLGLVMVLWFAAAQMQHHMSHMATRNFGFFAVAYLLAFPFAAVTEDGSEGRGLKWVGRIYMAFSLFMVLCGILLQLDAVPEALAAQVYWDGTRARLFWHPNGSAFVLLLGIGFSLFFLAKAEKKWEKILWAVLTGLQYFNQILTNSRTTIYLSCALIAGTVFFTLWKGSWKQFLKGAVAAVLVFAVLLVVHSKVFDLHTQVQVEKLLAQWEEQTEESQSSTQQIYVDDETGEYVVAGSVSSTQGDLSQDMKTLNGRTEIWSAAMTVMEDNPTTKRWGTEYVAEELSFRNRFPVGNAHNSWLQIWLRLGQPAFLLTIVYTVIAVWNLWILMWRKGEDLSKKVVAMMVICLLMGGLLEAYLFTGEDASNCENFLFFLCTGYLVQWNRLAAGKK